jgi:hypothetical protein
MLADCHGLWTFTSVRFGERSITALLARQEDGFLQVMHTRPRILAVRALSPAGFHRGHPHEGYCLFRHARLTLDAGGIRRHFDGTGIVRGEAPIFGGIRFEGHSGQPCGWRSHERHDRLLGQSGRQVRYDPLSGQRHSAPERTWRTSGRAPEPFLAGGPWGVKLDDRIDQPLSRDISVAFLDCNHLVWLEALSEGHISRAKINETKIYIHIYFFPSTNTMIVQ